LTVPAKQATGGFQEVAIGWFSFCLLVVFPAAVISGLQFPLLIGLLGRGSEQLGKQVGFAYAWNTAGAILGSLAGGFGALPLLTATGTWLAVVWLIIVLATLMLAVSWKESSRPRLPARIPAVVAIAVAVVCTFQTGPTAVWRHSGIGAGRSKMPEPTPNATRKWMHEQRRKVVWEAEGIESSIAITATDGLSFIVNGKSDGNAVSDAATQIGLAIVGAILHPEPEMALVIGLARPC
jgi:MFS family permease